MTAIFSTAEEAEEAFYNALERGDLDALMSIWADDEEIVCIHPTGQRLAGTAAIRESWRSIFSNNPRFTVRIKHRIRWTSVLLCAHHVVESLYLGEEATPHGPMLSTNVFLRGVHGWRMLSRHTSVASASDPEELTSEADYGQPRTLH